MYCTKCGNMMSVDAKFCTKCGTQASDFYERSVNYDGTVYKCPNCGEMLNSFLTVCGLCGYELRGVKGSYVVKELAEKLQNIESTREPISVNAFVGRIYGDLGKTDELKINLIRNFPIPNTKEDISEFMILAASNIDAKLYGMAGDSVLTVSQKAVSDAWIAKFEQAYQKAKFTFANDSDFYNIQSLYEQKTKEIKRKKFQLPLLFIGVFGAFIVMVLFMILVGSLVA